MISAHSIELLSWLWPVLLVLAFCYVERTRSSTQRGFTKQVLWMTAGAGLAGAVQAILCVEVYGGQDAYNYFVEGQRLRNLILYDPQELYRYIFTPDSFALEWEGLDTLRRTDQISRYSTFFTIGVAATFGTLFGNNYYAFSCAFGCLVGGTLALIISRTDHWQTSLFSVMFLGLPSLSLYVFGYGKEGLLVLAGLVALSVNPRSGRGVSNYLIGLAPTLVAAIVRLPHTILVVGGLITYRITRRLSPITHYYILFAVISIGAAGMILLDASVFNHAGLEKMQSLDEQFELLRGGSQLYRPQWTEATYGSETLQVVGWAIVTSLVPTAFLERWNAAYVVFTIMHIALLIYLLRAVSAMTRYNPRSVYVLIAAAACLILNSIVGNNAGTISRYHSPILFFLALSSILWKPDDPVV